MLRRATFALATLALAWGVTVPVAAQAAPPAPSSVTLTGPATPTVYGAAVPVSIKVACPADPAGTVVVRDGDRQVLSTAVGATGAVSAELRTLEGGAHALSAHYSGNPRCAASVSPGFAQVVTKAAPTLTAVSAASTSVYGQRVSLTATVGPVPGAPARPTGTVAFTDAGRDLLSAPIDYNGRAAAVVEELAVGTHTVVVAYPGDRNYSAAQVTVAQEVRPAATETSASSLDRTKVVGDQALVDVRVEVKEPGSGEPVGDVELRVGSKAVARGTLEDDGTAQLAVEDLEEGTAALVPVYLGNANFAASSGEPLELEVSASEHGPAPSTVPSENGSEHGSGHGSGHGSEAAAPAEEAHGGGLPVTALAGAALVLGLALGAAWWLHRRSATEEEPAGDEDPGAAPEAEPTTGDEPTGDEDGDEDADEPTGDEDADEPTGEGDGGAPTEDGNGDEPADERGPEAGETEAEQDGEASTGDGPGEDTTEAAGAAADLPAATDADPADADEPAAEAGDGGPGDTPGPRAIDDSLIAEVVPDEVGDSGQGDDEPGDTPGPRPIDDSLIAEVVPDEAGDGGPGDEPGDAREPRPIDDSLIAEVVPDELADFEPPEPRDGEGAGPAAWDPWDEAEALEEATAVANDPGTDPAVAAVLRGVLGLDTAPLTGSPEATGADSGGQDDGVPGRDPEPDGALPR